MRKTNIIKTVFAGMFFTMVAVTAVFANSHKEKVVITGNNEYYGQYEGIEGHYSVTGTQTYTTLRIVNITNGIRLFDGYVKRYNFSEGKYDLEDVEKVVTTPGQNLYPGVRRGTDGGSYNYIHYVDGYPSQYEIELTETYSYTVQQR